MPITHSPDDLHLRSRGTGDITYNIEGIDEEFREFCPAGPVADFLVSKQIVIGLGVVGSLVRGLTDMTTMPLYWVGYL